MRKHMELTQPGSCLNRADDFEMVFVLLGRDKAAPATIRFWCAERVRLGRNELSDTQIVNALHDADLIEKEQKLL